MKERKVLNFQTGRLQKVLMYIFFCFILSIVAGCGGVTMKLEVAINPSGENQKLHRDAITAYELHKILTDHFGYVSIKLSDAVYTLPDQSKLAQLQSSIYCREASAGKVKKGWGCDDYAIAAMVQMRNYAFGTMYVVPDGGTIQVMNVLVNIDKEVIYWEPQACSYYQGQFDKPEFVLF